MRITAVETVQVGEFANLVWVRLHTDEGLVGLGETFRNPEATVAYIHETCAPYLLGQDPRQVERHAHALTHRVGNRFQGFPSRSVELRGNSAVDIALWDLLGKALGQPLHQLLGGLSRERLRVYNTCASAGYNAQLRAEYDSRLVRADDPAGADGGPLDDLETAVHRPDELARSLLAEGVTAMKIWPFDAYALESDGHYLSAPDLERALRPVAAIRESVGDAMDVMLEYHGLWKLPTALRINAALRDYGVFWHEDPVAMHNLDDLAEYRRLSAPSCVCGSENLGTLAWYREVLPRRAIDVAHFDMGWIGGLTAGRKVAALAEAFDRPIAPHDCVGPVLLCADVHLVMAAPNALVQETVRAFVRGYYRELVTALPRIEGGFVHPMDGSGLGTELRPELFERPDVRLRRTAA